MLRHTSVVVSLTLLQAAMTQHYPWPLPTHPTLLARVMSWKAQSWPWGTWCPALPGHLHGTRLPGGGPGRARDHARHQGRQAEEGGQHPAGDSLVTGLLRSYLY